MFKLDEGEQIQFDGKFYTDAEIGFTDTGVFAIDGIEIYNPDIRYFTTVPISPVKHREHSPTEAAFSVVTPRTLFIYDDWGTKHVITGSEKIINQIIEECKLNKLKDLTR